VYSNTPVGSMVFTRCYDNVVELRYAYGKFEFIGGVGNVTVYTNGQDNKLVEINIVSI